MVKKPKNSPNTITVDANLFRLASLCISTDSGRWYLSGVYIEPHPKHQGVTLVATDGHKLINIYDEGGHADRPAIIALNKDMLKACRPQKSDEPSKRVLTVNLDEAKGTAQITLPPFDARDKDRTGFAILAGQGAVEVLGEFPNYRKVIPALKKTRTPAAYNSAYLTQFGDIGLGLAPKGSSIMVVHSDDPANPALVMWNGVSHAFGVLMPMRCDDKNAMNGTLPSWYVPYVPAPAPEPDPDLAPAKPAPARSTQSKTKKPARKRAAANA